MQTVHLALPDENDRGSRMPINTAYLWPVPAYMVDHVTVWVCAEIPLPELRVSQLKGRS